MTLAVLRQIIRDQVREMKRMGVIQDSCSPWACPVVLVKQKIVIGVFVSIIGN